MGKKIFITEQYKHNESVTQFIDDLPSSFEKGGKLLWNGRNMVKSFLQTDNNVIVVKRFKSLGVIQKLIYLFRKHKAYNAFHNGIKLLERGIQTPEPIACIELTSMGFIEKAYYICKRNGNPPIEDLLYRDDWDHDLAIAFAGFAYKLHKAGVLHHDLNDTNVRYSQEGGNYEFSLIDINRMSFYNNIEDIPMKDRIENLTRFTNRLSLFEVVAREYARLCNLDIETWIPVAIEQKKKHDLNRYRKKRLVHPTQKREKPTFDN